MFSVFPAFGWSYDHSELWANTFSNCNFSSQSPVNIQLAYTTHVDWWETLEYFNERNNSKVEYFMFISESILKVQVHGNFVLNGESLRATFYTIQLHFHWRYKSITRGSAHYIDGEGFPLEMHIVNKNFQYSDLTTAILHPDGIAIIAFFFEIEPLDNPMLSKIIDVLPDLGSKSMLLKDFSLSGLIDEGLKETDFFQYNGSIPVPPCNECVIWIIVKKPLSISRRQLEEIWKLSERDNMLGTNIRPVQPLYERLVWTTFSAADKAISSACCLLFLTMLCI
uniref:carbonic anhydrase n=2 Tax=Octopus bimaculoides TaxID=37653 RepID=A0A0L8GUI8_OCTBM